MDTRQDAIRRLQEAGIRPSDPRIAILAYVRSVKCHPAAETVYHALHKEHPTLSLTTVYNTLKLFAEAGLVLQLDLDATETHFDGCTDTHAHFRCRKCATIFDIDMTDSPNVSLPPDFIVEGTSLSYTGLCPQCAVKGE